MSIKFLYQLNCLGYIISEPRIAERTTDVSPLGPRSGPPFGVTYQHLMRYSAELSKLNQHRSRHCPHPAIPKRNNLRRYTFLVSPN